MKITELTAIHVRIPLRKPIRHASHTRSATDNLVIRCVLEDEHLIVFDLRSPEAR